MLQTHCAAIAADGSGGEGEECGGSGAGSLHAAAAAGVCDAGEGGGRSVAVDREAGMEEAAECTRGGGETGSEEWGGCHALGGGGGWTMLDLDSLVGEGGVALRGLPVSASPSSRMLTYADVC